MSTNYRLASAAAAALFAVMVSSAAFGQAQNKDQQKCINKLNKDTCKVAAAQGKENSGCVKSAGKGAVSPACLLLDSKGKVGKKTSKTTADETKGVCLTTNAPSFGYTPAASANKPPVNEEVNLFRDVYGQTDPNGVISTVKATNKCQAAMTKDLEKLIATKWKQYLSCKKNALKNGAINIAALLACLQGDPNSVAADPKGKILKAAGKIGSDFTKKCTGVDTNVAFPGKCAGLTGAALQNCLDRLAECRLCLAVDAIDNMNFDCDLFDDGDPNNGTCAKLPEHKCVLAAGSDILIYSAAFPVPLTFPTTGSAIDIGGLGSASVCDVQKFNPVNIASIGFVCIKPAGGCAVSTRYCGPGAPGSGPPLGIDSEADGNVGGACAGNTACATTCAGFCAPGVVQNAGCTGFCTGTTPANMACTTDAQCAAASNGACNGPDSPPVGFCQCSCTDNAAFGPSDPGDLQCNLGAKLVVETGAPCDGTDILINVGNACIPVSTQEARGKITDANFIPASTVPGPPQSPNANDRTGVPLACATVDMSVTTGLTAVGAVNFFGSTIGDLSVGLKTVCQ
jgi:hypothetical protein